ncbi:MAG: peptidase C15 [Myxococcota bacterium]|nr:peptidase C15 [Myxococcota bacterium]
MSEWILVTAFGPFPGVAVNPTQALAARLAPMSFEGLPVVCRVLDVSYQRSAEQLLEELAAGWPRFMVHFGVATGSDRVAIETRAINRMTSVHPDVDGRRFEGSPIRSDHPPDAAMFTQVAAQRLVTTLDEQGLPARLSDDAGRYVCNAIYFNALAGIAAAGLALPCIFVHVPPIGADPDPESATDTAWTHERLFQAASQVIGWMAANPPDATIRLT